MKTPAVPGDSPRRHLPVGDEVTRLSSIGRGTCVDRGTSESNSESPDVDSYGAPTEAGAFWEWRGSWMGRGTSPWSEEFPPQPVGDEVTRLTPIGRGTCVDRGASESKSESPHVDSYGPICRTRSDRSSAAGEDARGPRRVPARLRPLATGLWELPPLSTHPRRCSSPSHRKDGRHPRHPRRRAGAGRGGWPHRVPGTGA